MSNPPSSAGSTPQGVECVVPILCVNDLSASLRFYVDMLGFKVDWTDSGMASVSSEGHGLMLCQGGQGHPGTWLWIGVQNIEPLYERYRGKGVKFRRTPTNYPWAYEMQIEDPDGHILRFGSEPKADEPYARAVDF